ncbi:MAG: hypothetical protein ABIO92_10560 [Chloroflexia bacterium]
MILVRDVFQAKYGRGDELVQLFKEINDQMSETAVGERKLLTDLSGPFFMVVTEIEAESMDAYFAGLREGFSRPEFGQLFGRMQELVESGRREFYTIEGSR